MGLEEVYCLLRERIVRYASSRVGDPAAEDLAQEVLILLHERQEKFAHLNEKELTGLSIKMTKIKMWEIHRKASRRGEYNRLSLDDIQVADTAADPQLETERKQIMERLMASIDHLRSRCRQLMLWKLEGKSFPEIKTLFGASSINTIYTWDSRCRKELLNLMGGSWENR
jgi:RNA polymerase sigma-70 factor (ECF subfamily)